MIGSLLMGKRRRSRRILRLADRARDAKEYDRAAYLFERYLNYNPDNGPIHVQCGHMFKEAGKYERAEHHYEVAKRLMPDNPDLALQLGHFYKITGRLKDAKLAYSEAIRLAPDCPEPAIELAQLNSADILRQAELTRD